MKTNRVSPFILLLLLFFFLNRKRQMDMVCVVNILLFLSKGYNVRSRYVKQVSIYDRVRLLEYTYLH